MPEGEPHLGCMFRFWLEGVEPRPNRTNGQSRTHEPLPAITCMLDGHSVVRESGRVQDCPTINSMLPSPDMFGEETWFA